VNSLLAKVMGSWADRANREERGGWGGEVKEVYLSSGEKRGDEYYCVGKGTPGHPIERREMGTTGPKKN